MNIITSGTRVWVLAYDKGSKLSQIGSGDVTGANLDADNNLSYQVNVGGGRRPFKASEVYSDFDKFFAALNGRVSELKTKVV